MKYSLKVIILSLSLIYNVGFSQIKLVKEGIEYASNKYSKTALKQVLKKSSKKLTSLNSVQLKKLETTYNIKKNENGALKIFSRNGKNYLGEIRGKTITALPGYNSKSFNKLLDDELLPNFNYKIENTIYKTDKYGRVSNVNTSNFPKSMVKKPRNRSRQSIGNLSKNGIKGVDQGGHLIANQLGGISETINIIPQNAKMNQGEWKKIENFISKNTKFIKNHQIKLFYVGKSKRPVSMEVLYEYKGRFIKHDNLINNVF